MSIAPIAQAPRCPVNNPPRRRTGRISLPSLMASLGRIGDVVSNGRNGRNGLTVSRSKASENDSTASALLALIFEIHWLKLLSLQFSVFI